MAKKKIHWLVCADGEPISGFRCGTAGAAMTYRDDQSRKHKGVKFAARCVPVDENGMDRYQVAEKGGK